MRVHNHEPVIIFSAYQRDMPKVINEVNHGEIISTLTRCNVPYKELTGSYKGRLEKSVMIPAAKGRYACIFGRLFNQETYLELDNERGAHITDAHSGESKFIGFWIPVTKESALVEESWTRKDGQHFIVSATRLNGHLQR